MVRNIDTTIFNIEEFESIRSILKDRFPELIDGYFKDTEQYIKNIDEGIKSNNLEIIASSAHPLKSSSSALGMSSISEIAKDIEEIAKKKGKMQDIKELITPLYEAIDYIKSKVRDI